MLSPRVGNTSVEIRDGVVAIEGRPILRQIDLAVPTGQFVTLLGANGSGKSTLVRALTGLRLLASGQVWLFGTPLAQFHDWRRVGFVPQRTNASGGVPASVWEVAAAGRLPRRRLFHPASAADRRAVSQAIAAVGLAGRERDGIATLSGGEQQRVLIARALAGEPDLFLLDEPMAGVDLGAQQSLADLLAGLKAAGSTVVLVAHELGALAPLVDRAVVMRDGRIIHDGALPSDQDLHQPAYGEHPAPGGQWRVLDAGHTHHHHERPHEDHVPHVGAPLDRAAGHGGE
jgi:zinc transport system ATP-binding protein